jgi:hypothetical protein
LLLNTCAFSSSRSASSDTSRSSPSGSPHSSSFRFHYHHSPPLQPRKHLHLSAVWFLKNFASAHFAFCNSAISREMRLYVANFDL